MHVELVDLFRCTAEHEDAWLIAAAMETRFRQIVHGVLGCPVCGAEYPVRNGVVHFDSEPAERRTLPPRSAHTTDDDAFRLAALLDLAEPGRTIVLDGFTPADAVALLAIVPTRIVLVDRAADNRDDTPDDWMPRSDVPIAHIRVGTQWPIATGSLHGLATTTTTPGDAVHLLRSGGRLVAPSQSALPAGTTEIARDHRQWVATRDVIASTPVQLRRQPRR